MSTASTLDRRTLSALRSERRRRARKYLMLYGFCVIPVAALFVFHYIPIYGILLAFKDFRYNLGILGSPWNDFQHFRDLFTDPFFPRIVRNSVIISVLKLAFAFPAPILLAILINEIHTPSLKRTIQSIADERPADAPPRGGFPTNYPNYSPAESFAFTYPPRRRIGS